MFPIDFGERITDFFNLVLPLKKYRFLYAVIALHSEFCLEQHMRKFNLTKNFTQ